MGSDLDKQESSWPAWLPLVVLVVGFICLIVAGGVAYWLAGDRLRAYRTWTGQLTPAQPANDIDACKARLGSYAEKLAASKNSGKWPDADKETPPKCPRSGSQYCYLVNPDSQQAWLFCPGEYHGQANTPAYNFDNHQLSDKPVEPPQRTLNHFLWLWETGNPEGLSKALEEIGQFESDHDRAARYRAMVLLQLERYSEAFSALQTMSSGGKEQGTARSLVSALMHQGRYEEALQVARDFDTDDDDMLYYLSGDLQRAQVESRADGGDTTLMDMFIPLAQGDLAAPYPVAVKYLEDRGFVEYASPYLVLGSVVSARASKDKDKLEKAKGLLARALREAPRKWPFALLQMYNRELTPEKVEELARGNDSQLTEYHTWQALLLEAKGQAAEARPHFQWVADHGNKGYFEYRIGLNRVAR